VFSRPPRRRSTRYPQSSRRGPRADDFCLAQFPRSYCIFYLSQFVLSINILILHCFQLLASLCQFSTLLHVTTRTLRFLHCILGFIPSLVFIASEHFRSSTLFTFADNPLLSFTSSTQHQLPCVVLGYDLSQPAPYSHQLLNLSYTVSSEKCHQCSLYSQVAMGPKDIMRQNRCPTQSYRIWESHRLRSMHPNLFHGSYGEHSCPSPAPSTTQNPQVRRCHK
jgi:hypothetical protein